MQQFAVTNFPQKVDSVIAKERLLKGVPVLGAERLKQQRYLCSHKLVFPHFY